MERLVKIVLTKFGNIEARDVEFVRNALNGCYLQLEPHEVTFLDLYLFESATLMRAFFINEKHRMGIASRGFDDAFVAQHDAWRGASRISICLERLRLLPREAQIGSIEHEVGHSILHGGIEYYVIPQSLIPPFVVKHSSEESARSFLDLVSIAVKDYEVTRYLFGRGCDRGQVAYVINVVDATEDDKLAWRISRGNRVAEILCIVSRLKEVCCAAPFLQDERFRNDIEDRLVKNLSYMGCDVVTKLMFIARHELPELGADTMKNIGVLSDLLLRTFQAE